MTASAPLRAVFEPKNAPEAFTDTVLEIIAKATWADGSPLVEVDEAILRREIGNKIRVAAYNLAATSTMLPAAAAMRGAR